MCNIIDKGISFMEEIQPNHPNSNRSKSKYHSNNTINSNYNVGNELGYKEF